MLKTITFYIFALVMLKLRKLYSEHKNGIIFTLVFHIFIFLMLNIGQFRIKQEFKEPEIIIDFPFEAQAEPIVQQQETIEENNYSSVQQTNIASNKATNNNKNILNEQLQRELEQAQDLVNRVSRQLQKEIPTIHDLKMPEETTEGLNPDSIMNKLYSGNSNVEYFLENRYHIRLPIPVYLSQYEGIITINIVVDLNGQVISAEPTNSNLNEQLLSYAKTAALRTRFNPDNKADKRQTGYIKYHFIAQ